MIKINEELYLESFNNVQDKEIINNILGISKSNFLPNVDQKIKMSKETDFIKLNNSYLVIYNDNPIGFIYLSGKTHDYYYIEYMILKNYRHQGLGTYVLGQVSDKIFETYSDIMECHLSIDRSNIASIMAATNNNFIEDDETIDDKKMEFIKDNPYYIRKYR